MVEPRHTARPSRTRLPWYAWVMIIVTGVVFFIIMGVTIAATIYLSPDRIEQIINDQLVETTEGRFEAHVRGTSAGFISRSFAIDGLSIEPTEVAFDEGTHPPRYHLEVDRLESTGIGLWNLWRHDRFTASSVNIVRPVLQMDTTDDPLELDEYLELVRLLPQDERLRGTRVGSFHIEDAQIETTPLEGIEGRTQTIEGFSLTLDDFFIDPDTVEDEDRLLITRGITMQVDRYHTLTADEIYAFELTDLTLDTPDSTFSIAGMTFAPTVPDETVFEQQPWGITRYQSDVGTVQFEGIDFRSLIVDRAFIARSAVVDTFHVDIFHNTTDVDNPDPGAPFPHEMAQDGQLTLDIGEIQVGRGFVQYAERAPGADEPGIITFEAIEGLAQHFFSAPDRRAEQPTLIEGQTLLNGAGLFEIRAEYDLTDPDFMLDVSGSLSAMSLLPFNRMFERREGIQITGGRIHNAAFDLAIRQNIAEGVLQFQYEGLGIDILDTAIASPILRGLGRLLTNQVLRQRTLPEVPGEDIDFEATILLERDPDHTFFQFLWFALRDGIFQVVGINRLLR